MENTVSINHTKDNTLEFELSMEGVDTKDIDVRFVVESKGMDLNFAAKKKKGDVWAVKLPRLPMLEKTAYKFHIEVITDGYFFKPFEGNLNVVGSAELYSTKPKNVTLEPNKEEKPVEDAAEKEEKKKKEEKKVEEKKVVEEAQRNRTRSREKSIEQIARELMEQQNYSPKKIEDKVKEVKEAEAQAPVTNANRKDQQILTILEEVGIKTKRKGRFRFTLPESLEKTKA